MPGVETPPVLAGDMSIQADQPQRAAVLLPVQGALGRQIGVIGEGGAQGGAVVVIAGDDEEGHGQLGQHLAQGGVFLGGAEVHQVAGDDQGIRARLQGVEAVHRQAQGAEGIDHPVGQPAAGLDVQVAELGQQEGRVH